MSGPSTIASTGRKIGYARVSAREQKLRMQRDALNPVGCGEIFEDGREKPCKSARASGGFLAAKNLIDRGFPSITSRERDVGA